MSKLLVEYWVRSKGNFDEDDTEMPELSEDENEKMDPSPL